MINKNIKNFIIGGLFLFSLLFYCNVPLVFGQTSTGGTYDFKKQSGLSSAAQTAGYETGTSASSLETIISQTIYAILGLVGLIFFGYLIYGGYIWMTARGNEEKIKQASSTLMNSILGLVVTLGAYAISYLLLSYF